MRKHIIGPPSAAASPAASDWLDLEPLASVEVSSEEPGYPIETALGGELGPGWRAATPGPQTVRLIFDQPQQLRRIRLVFGEDTLQRTQEFALRWSADRGRSYRDVLRQQYTFSPPGTVEEVEDYRVELAGVTIITLQIVPDIGGGPARASLVSMQLA
jgi:hypothetical protein